MSLIKRILTSVILFSITGDGFINADVYSLSQNNSPSRCVVDDKQLSCDIGNGENKSSVSKSLDFVLDTGPGGSCDSGVYPPLNRTDGVYSDINDGFGFGESTNASALSNFNIANFIAYSNFGTDKVDFFRRLIFVPAPTNFNQAHLGMLSISKCPGDFTSTAVCTRTLGTYATIHITTREGEVSDLYCQFERGVNYYINFAHSADPYSQLARCNNIDKSTCAWFWSESNTTPPD